MRYVKFESWFPYYGGVLDRIIQGTCEAKICNINANCTQERINFYAAQDVEATSRCYELYDCLAAGLLPNEAANFQSAQVLLGLTPALLATLAPSISEIALISTDRRIFALLLMLGNPAVYVARLLHYDDPSDQLHGSADTVIPTALLYLKSPMMMLAALVIQYVLALGAILNVAEVSWRLGVGTVVAWKCASSWLPFLWATLSLAVHLLASTSWYLVLRRSAYQRSQSRPRSLSRVPTMERTWERSMIKRIGAWLASLLQRIFTAAYNELELDEFHPDSPLNRPPDSTNNDGHKTAESSGGRESDDNRSRMYTMILQGQATATGSTAPRAPAPRLTTSKLSRLLNQLAGLAAFLQIVFGSLVLSSLTFIATLDAAGVIARYLASALVCRALVAWELARIRRRLGGGGRVDNGETSG